MLHLIYVIVCCLIVILFYDDVYPCQERKMKIKTYKMTKKIFPKYFSFPQQDISAFWHLKCFYQTDAYSESPCANSGRVKMSYMNLHGFPNTIPILRFCINHSKQGFAANTANLCKPASLSAAKEKPALLDFNVFFSDINLYLYPPCLHKTHQRRLAFIFLCLNSNIFFFLNQRRS